MILLLFSECTAAGHVAVALASFYVPQHDDHCGIAWVDYHCHPSVVLDSIACFSVSVMQCREIKSRTRVLQKRWNADTRKHMIVEDENFCKQYSMEP